MSMRGEEEDLFVFNDTFETLPKLVMTKDVRQIKCPLKLNVED